VNAQRPSFGKSAWRIVAAWSCVVQAFTAAPAATPPTEESAYFIRVWRADDGLPPLLPATRPTLVEAPEGYLWMEAKAGPVRFDGERVTVFSAAKLGWPEGATITTALPDKIQGLWVILSDRSVWRERAGQWQRWVEFKGEEIPEFIQPSDDAEGGVYLSTSQGRLLRCVEDVPGIRELIPAGSKIWGWQGSSFPRDTICYSIAGKAFRWTAGKVEPAPIIDPDPDRPYYFSWRDGSMWIIGQQHVFLWKDGAFRKLPSIPNRGSETLAGIIPAPPHGVWASTANKLFFFPTGGTEWRGPFPWGTRAEQRQLTNLTDAQGHHWIATNGFGFLHVSPEGKQIPERLPPELAVNRIPNFIEDRERNIWALAEGSGLVRLRARRFTVHRPGFGLTDPEILAVAEDAAGALWAGSRAGGADVLEHGVWRHVALPPGDQPDAGISALLPLADGSLLAGTISLGVWRRQGESWVQMGAKDEKVRAIFADRSGTLWMGSKRGLFQWLDSDWIPVLSQRPCPLVHAIAEDASGRLWVGTEEGVWRHDPNGGFAPVPASEGLPTEPAQGLLADADGSMWVGGDSGLALWRDGKAARFTPENGLPVTRVFAILHAGRDQLWVSSPEGLVVLDYGQFAGKIPGKIAGQVFTRADGLPTREASGGFQPALWHGKDGRCWLPTHQGLVEFDPLTLPPAAPPPPVIIEDATASHEGMRTPLRIPPLRASAVAIQSELPAQSRRLEFHFTSPSLGAPEKVLFRWRLEGLDAAWSDPSPQRFATYPYVPPGDYRFRVIACNGDGVWNETGVAVPFLIPQLWHERAIFWVVLVLLGSGVALGGVRLSYLRRIERMRLLSALDHERARIAQDIHDDLGAKLTQISMWSAFVQKRADPAIADRLRLIRERSNEAVRSLDQIVWAVNPGNDTVRKFATYVCQAVADFFRETEMACRIDLAEAVEDGVLNAEVRHHLVLAVREACTNALRHAAATEVSLQVEASPDRIRIVIADNGRGFDVDADPGHGEGLKGMKRRLATTGGLCSIESAPEKGTRVLILWKK
jgi:signal transduction histidine kinase/ligand-binding sensor domain-containing protein